MAGKKGLIGLINDKCSGKPYDVKKYVTTMDKIMGEAYNSRHINPRSFQDDLEGFRNLCWEKLEDNNLAYKFADMSFENDIHLIRYIRKAFGNILRDRIDELSPGFRTRMKQVNKVLSPHCLNTCKDLCKCWKLKEFRRIALKPADLGQLQDASCSVSLPKLRIPKMPDSKRGPSIKDKEMELYLISLLKEAGGMTTRNDLLSFIRIEYGLFPIKQVIPSIRDDESGRDKDSIEDQITRLTIRSGSILMGADHALMARELFDGMAPEMKDIHYHRIIKGKKIKETAHEMKKSVGTIHNIEKTYQEYVHNYFNNSGNRPIPEEAAAIIDIVSSLILGMRKKS